MHAANAINCRAQHLYFPTHLRSARLHSLCIHAFCLIAQLTAMLPLGSIDLLLLVIETVFTARYGLWWHLCCSILFNVDCKFGSDPV